ncbi:hypothetical protein ACIPIU_00315 [Streptomyces massasporeus]
MPHAQVGSAVTAVLRGVELAQFLLSGSARSRVLASKISAAGR